MGLDLQTGPLIVFPTFSLASRMLTDGNILRGEFIEIFSFRAISICPTSIRAISFSAVDKLVLPIRYTFHVATRIKFVQAAKKVVAVDICGDKTAKWEVLQGPVCMGHS